MPPRSKIGGHICFCPVCHSVILSFCNSVLLSETLTLIITFEQWVLELWYFTWVFLVIRPFRGYHYFLPCGLDLGVWATFLKLYFWTVNANALIPLFHMSFPCDKTFPWVPLFFFYKYKSFHIAHEHFLWQDLPTGIKIFVLVILVIMEFANIGGICVS